jgi:hypothetical protein
MTGLASSLGDLPEVGLVGGALDVEDEVLALADAGHLRVAQPAQRAEHRLALGVGDLRLEDDVDDHLRHGSRAYRARAGGPTALRSAAEIT